jgi:hypothetical protein
LDWLVTIDEAVKEAKLKEPRAKITRNQVIRHFIKRGMEYCDLIDQGMRWHIEPQEVINVERPVEDT